MNMLPDFRCLRPTTVAEAVRLKAENPDSKVLAGGTDLIVNLRRGLGEPAVLIDLSAVTELSDLTEGTDGALVIGAGVTLAALAADPRVRAGFPALAEAALTVAGPTHRAAATLGGNLCQDTRCIYYNQSEWWRASNDYCLKYRGDRCHVVTKSDRCYATYHGDVAPVLMVLGAEAELAGPAGTRRLKLAELFREVGSDHLALGPDEVLVAVTVPPAAGRVAGYIKTRIREAIDFPLAGVAVSLRRDGDRIAELTVAITGTNSAPLLVPTAELVGGPWDDDAATKLAAAARKVSNVLRTTIVGAKYRRRVLLATAKRLVDRLWGEAG